MENKRKQVPKRSKSIEKKANLKSETYRRSQKVDKISFIK